MSDVLVKSVKFLERPGPDKLKDQITLMTRHLELVCAYAGNLDIKLTHADIMTASQQQPAALPQVRSARGGANMPC